MPNHQKMDHFPLSVLFVCLVLLFASCSSTRARKKPTREFARMGAPSVVVNMQESGDPAQSRCRPLGRVKVDFDVAGRGLNDALEELKAVAFVRGADHALVRDHTAMAVYADLYFCANDYSDYKKGSQVGPGE